MSLFHELISNSTNVDTLQSFVINNINRFHNLNNGHYSKILAEKDDAREFIESKGDLLEKINYDFSQCKAFISILFDFCERFGFLCIARIENTLSKRDLYLGKRREAAKLFLLQVRDNDDYIIRFEQICTLIQCSIETEEDSEVKPVVTFLNFFAKIVRDTSEIYIEKIKSKISHYSNNFTYPFLLNQVIQDVWSISTDDIDKAYLLIQSKIETYLGHVTDIESDIKESTEEILIETDSEYSHLLAENPVTFDLVRKIAVNKCANISHDLPGRGVNPLRSENEMFIYLRRYGNMHKAKLLSAFERFPFNDITFPIEIIDWGCGQGLASLVLLDYLKTYHITLNIRKIILIEPSELSLKRAALHISHATHNIPLRTICNAFDSLSVEEIHTPSNDIKLHLFSNVLDIDESIFSQYNLIKNIVSTQKGTNYFFCISPYITDEKADRLDAFKRYFQQHYDSFEDIFATENSGRIDADFWYCNNTYKYHKISHGTYFNCKEHTENGCNNKWTRIIKLFKVEL